MIEIASRMVRFARSLGCDDVEFSPEDAGRFACFYSSLILRKSLTLLFFFITKTAKKLEEFWIGVWIGLHCCAIG